MRFAHFGLLLGLGLLAGCSGKKQDPLPDPVDFELKVKGIDGNQYVLTLKAVDEDIAKRSKTLPSGVFDKKTGTFKGKAVPGSYEVSAQPVPQGQQGGNQGPGGQTISATMKPTPLGNVTISSEGAKPNELKFPG